MSQYSTLQAGPFLIDSCRNDIEPPLMAIFVPTDKYSEAITLEQWIEMDGDPEHWSPSYANVHYICSCRAMRDRLDLLGFTLDTANAAFVIGRDRELLEARREVASLEANLKHGPPEHLGPLKAEVANDVKNNAERMLPLYRERVEALARINPDLWVQGLRETRRLGLAGRRIQPVETCDIIVKYIANITSTALGFPGVEKRLMLRLLLEACETDDSVDYDLTDLIVGDQFSSSDDMVAYAEALINREHEIYRRIIVLTEGSSDRWILEGSLKLLYPHLSEFFSFMDFEGARVEGGAGALANLVRAFAGAKVSNRVVAIFDNDTGGRSALHSLAQVRLPENIVVMRLPRLPFAESYPTQGPTGISLMDINDLACSLELYLGTDVLRMEDGTYTPVEWKGLDGRLRQYQGEILGKFRIQDLFRQKLARCEADASEVASSDWTGMELVLAHLRQAFQAHDSSQHLEVERWHSSEEYTSPS